MGRIGLIACLFCLPVLAAEKPAPVVVLADAAEYRTAKAMEMVFDGVLERTPSKGTLGGPARFNPYRLSGRDGSGKPLIRELFVGDKAPLLAVHVGQRLRVVGKLVEVEADGAKRLELWPARIEAISEAIAETPPTGGVFARVYWQPASALKPGARHYVFRNGAQLAQEMRVSGATADNTATTLMASRLRVPGIDWTRYMVVTVSAGQLGPGKGDRLIVTRVAVEDDQMTIHYKLETGPGPPASISYPAETVLVDRFAGSVRVEIDKAPPTP